MNLREKGTKWLADKIEQQVSSDVLYRRGSLSLPIRAGRLKGLKQIIDANGALTTQESFDFSIRAELLSIDDERLTPRAGDVIEVETEHSTKIYRVKSFGDPNGDPFTWCDPFGRQYRVHTEFAGEVEKL